MAKHVGWLLSPTVGFKIHVCDKCARNTMGKAVEKAEFSGEKRQAVEGLNIHYLLALF